MSRSRHQVDAYYNRDISLHKPGVIPNSSRLISPITSNRHKYELKQRIWPKKTVESWFANHSSDERRAVYSFLDTLNKAENPIERRAPVAQPSRRIRTAREHSPQRRRESQNSKRDLDEVMESLERFGPSSSAREKGVQTSGDAFTIPFPPVNGGKPSERPSTTTNGDENPSTDNERASRRYLSQTWRVINPRDDAEQNVRPDNNTSSFFNYTKKAYPEYFFIHPDWY